MRPFALEPDREARPATRGRVEHMPLDIQKAMPVKGFNTMLDRPLILISASARRSCRAAGRPASFVIALALIGLLAGLLPQATLARQISLAEQEARIAANDWKWEADDSFSRSLSIEERANLRGYNPPPGYDRELQERLIVLPASRDDLPVSIDWRDVGQTPVKNQGQCGSCWAFAAAAELEAYVKIYYGVELDVSEQQIISCNPYGADCGGGWAGAAYYVFSHHGAVSEACIPYEGEDPPVVPCNQGDFNPYGFITGWHSIANNVEQIKLALQTGPVCTAIYAGADFENYGSGCFDVVGGGTNHLVLIVGYDDRLCDDNGAWIIKNSWGPGWGMAGYGYIQYGAASTGNGVTQLEYAPPPVDVTVTGPTANPPLIGGGTGEITWSTAGDMVSSVDIYFGLEGCHDWPVALGVPNTGSLIWDIPNEATENGSFLDGLGQSSNLFSGVLPVNALDQ